MIENTVSSQMQKNTVTVPEAYHLKLKLDLLLTQSTAASYDSFIHSLSRKRYGGSEIGNRLFGTAAVMVP